MPFTNINSRNRGGYLEDKIKHDNAIIIYHWNSCGHCRELMPILYSLLRQEEELRNRSNIFEVEYSNFQYLPSFLTNVSAFPYIVAYSNGNKVEEFNEQRTPERLKLFISRNSSKMEGSKMEGSKMESSRKKKLLKSYK